MRIAVVSHDAGCSEILCALIQEHFDQASWHIYAPAESPMGRICVREGLPFSPLGDPREQLGTLKPDCLFFGTGWQERIEFPYLHYCKTHAIPTVAFLDHWSSYRERFGYPRDGWENNLGDFTAVSDEKALNLAYSFGLPHPVALPNFYLRKLIKQAGTKAVIRTEELLFLSEPTDQVALNTYGDKNYWGFDQYSALEDILEHFERFECEGLAIRLHPSDSAEGYRALLTRYPHIRVRINTAAETDMIGQLLSAKMVIGFDTMALYTAALLGRAVLSYLPSANREFLLPLPIQRQVRSLDPFPEEALVALSLDLDHFGMDFALFLETITGTD